MSTVADRHRIERALSAGDAATVVLHWRTDVEPLMTEGR